MAALLRWTANYIYALAFTESYARGRVAFWKQVMDGYVMFGKMIVCHVMPPDKVNDHCDDMCR